MSWPQSVSYKVSMKVYLSSDGRSDAIGKTLAVQLSQAGEAFGNPSAGVVNATEMGNGWYSYTLSTTDMSVLGDLVVRFTGTGVDPAERILPIINPRNGGLSALPDTAVTSNNSLITSGTGTNQLTLDSGRVLLQTTQTASIAAAVWQAPTTTDWGVNSFGNYVIISNNTNRSIGVTGAGSGHVHSVVHAMQPNVVNASALATDAIVEIRTDLDTNSTRLANLDATVSSRTTPSDILSGLNAQGYTTTRAAYLDTLNGLVNSIWNAIAYGTTSFRTILSGFRFTVANQVDANALTSVGGGGGTIQNIVYITPALAQASLTPNKILAKRGDLLTVALPAMGNISSRTGANRLVFTVKNSVDDADSAAILQIVEGTGLTVFKGAPATDSTQGSLTVSDATLGIAIVSVKGTAMAQMLVRDYVWDQQAILPTGPLSPNQGVFSVYGDVTRLT